ncbi:MAG TPA: phosphate ABC transporter permease PstA [Candidatus Angelobacter sp.]|jgi:phosphate transport system permease protein|nr:phosphate ABC transporter permease PstA [Candidatus Angelobacter sp.]
MAVMALDIPRRPRSVHRDDLLVLAATAVSSFCVVWLVYGRLSLLSNSVGYGFWWAVTFLAMYWLANRALHGSLMARDRLMSAVMCSAALFMLVPLLTIIGYLIYQGIGVIRPAFLTDTVQFCGQLDGTNCGGVGHAIIGTLEEVGIAMVMAVPLAVLCAVFLNEIGGRMKRPVRLFVDAMSGVPSIVAGLFIYAIWVVSMGRGFSGFAAALALAILMLPTVTRTAEEVLRLVPDGLREGALALGASEWRTVWGVVLPTARSGLITAVILGVARAVGETAPLIFTSFGASVMNVNPLAGDQEALPHFVYQYIQYQPNTGPYQRAWGAALVLTFLVLALFTMARIAGRGLPRRVWNRMTSHFAQGPTN